MSVLLIEQKLTIAMAISDRALVMGHGSIVFQGTPDDAARRRLYPQGVAGGLSRHVAAAGRRSVDTARRRGCRSVCSDKRAPRSHHAKIENDRSFLSVPRGNPHDR